VRSNQKHQPPATSTGLNKNKAPVEKKRTAKSLPAYATKKQVQSSTRSRDLTPSEVILLQKAYSNQLTTRDMRLPDLHIYENATEVSEAILDSSVEEAETDLVPQVLEEGNEKKVVDDTYVLEDTDVEIFPLAASSVTASSKNGTTTNGTSPKTYRSCKGEGRATISTSNTTTTNINHDGSDTTTNNTTDKNGKVKTEQFQISHTPANQMYVDLSLSSGSSVSITIGSQSDSSVSLSIGPQSD
jgi:hypothetical protein